MNEISENAARLRQIAADLRAVTWLAPVSAAEMNKRDRWLADQLDAVADSTEERTVVVMTAAQIKKVFDEALTGWWTGSGDRPMKELAAKESELVAVPFYEGLRCPACDTPCRPNETGGAYCPKCAAQPTANTWCPACKQIRPTMRITQQDGQPGHLRCSQCACVVGDRPDLIC